MGSGARSGGRGCRWLRPASAARGGGRPRRHRRQRARRACRRAPAAARSARRDRAGGRRWPPAWSSCAFSIRYRFGRAASTDAQHQHQLGDALLGGRVELGRRQQHRLRLEDRLQLDEAVLAQRLAARDEVGDRLGGVQRRRQLDRAGDRDAGRGDAVRRPGSGRRWRGTRWRCARRRGRRRRVICEPAGAATTSRQRPKPSAQPLVQHDARLGHLVGAGDAAVDRPVLDPARGCRPRARTGSRRPGRAAARAAGGRRARTRSRRRAAAAGPARPCAPSTAARSAAAASGATRRAGRARSGSRRCRAAASARRA